MTSGGRAKRRIIHEDDKVFYVRENRGNNDIQKALEGHSSMLSVRGHKFVSSISTIDIQQLVSHKYSGATNKVEIHSKELSDKISAEINKYKSTNSIEEHALQYAISTLDRIKIDVEEFEALRKKAFESLKVLSDIIKKIFENKGIRINPSITFGDIENSINSDILSAGEKQMLSFLCYNALYNNCPIFIDEPELSLHVDWQRILIGVLLTQNTRNQLFIATHSPFIYSQYPDKEIIISSDRGFSVE